MPKVWIRGVAVADAGASAAVRRGLCLSNLPSQRWRERPAGGCLPVDLLEYRPLCVLPLGHGPGLSLQGLHRCGLGEIGDLLVDERRISDGGEGREVGRCELRGLVLGAMNYPSL